MLSEDEEIKERWSEYFGNLLNAENARDAEQTVSPCMGKAGVVERGEVVRALHKMKYGKACGPDEIPVESTRGGRC